MIPPERIDILDSGLSLLDSFRAATSARGRFIAVYLGLRRMLAQVDALPHDERLYPLGGVSATPTSKIEAFLDRMYWKTHCQEPFVVLTAPFGGAQTPEAPYSARSGTAAPGRSYPINTWRNNFGIQKGIGCPADVGDINLILSHPQRRLACRHMAVDPEGRHLCSLVNTNYRGEEHSVWLRLADGGYQVVDLDLPSVYQDYLRPGNFAIPIFPLIAVLYCRSGPDVYPARQRVGIRDFADDFAFSKAQVESLFDCDPESWANAALLNRIADETAPLQIVGEAGAEAPANNSEMPDEPQEASLNTGVGAELAVARELQAHGWSVFYRGNQRGLGYDLEAKRDDGAVLRVEVKSSVGFADLALQESEWNAAQRHGEEYVLAAVDFFGSSSQEIWYVRDPAATAVPTDRTVQLFRFLRADLEGLRTEAEFL